MAKSLAASQDIMKNYLSELLTDDSVEPEILSQEVSVDVKQTVNVEAKRLEKLLENVSTEKTLSTAELSKQYRKSKQVDKIPVVETKPQQPLVEKEVIEQDVLITAKSQGTPLLVKEKEYRKGSFQAMFFDVAGLLVAVPLIELGGIHNLEKTNNLMGKPAWFTGVMLHRDEQINVVDTALWVMPEKCDESLINSLNYQYVIMLSNSQWGLTAENLVDTVTLEQDEVKWLDKPSKRPWLAGLVKERMCALLDVEALIKLLDDGVGVFPN